MKRSLLLEDNLKKIIKTTYKNKTYYELFLNDNLLFKSKDEKEVLNYFNNIN